MPGFVADKLVEARQTMGSYPTIRASEELRGAIEFRCQDLRDEMPAESFDLILCRNVAFTYFDFGLQHLVAAQLAACIRPGGALVVGAHETLPEGTQGLAPWSEPLGIFRRLSDRGKPANAIRGSPDARDAD
jgi:chemotaxis methyl-accepting protein methylase